jgi:hypothetical protein
MQTSLYQKFKTTTNIVRLRNRQARFGNADYSQNNDTRTQPKNNHVELPKLQTAIAFNMDSTAY